MRKLVRRFIFSFIMFVSLYSITPIHAENPGTGPTDPRELEAFLDGYFADRMAENNIAGAAVSVVKDGRVLLAKGYGYADVTRHIPVDSETTVFTLGSLSKLFTWTAVMQLAEQGRLDLDADINNYLDFRIPATYPQPITLNNLMAHTSGFEDNKFGQMAASPGQLTPLGEWLKSHIPARVRPAGEFSAYGNYGAALAGYIVERVSGMKYDDYIDRNILEPLGMAHTTSRQPVPLALCADLSQCYLYVDGAYQPQAVLSEVAPNVAPAASFKASAADMAAFMIAHLARRSYGGAAILKPETVHLMHSRSFSHDPRVNGMAHGFWELGMNGLNIIGHAGSHFVFNSFLILFPDRNLGVFVATNSWGGSAFIGENFAVFQQAFVDHYFPKKAPVLTPPSDFKLRAGRFDGSYRMTYNRSDSTPEKLSSMMMSLKVHAVQDGLVVSMPSGNASFVEIGPLVFRRSDSDSLLVFRENEDGKITNAFYGPIPLTALEKSRWYESPGFNLPFLGICAILFLSFLITVPAAFFVRRRRADRTRPTLSELTAGLASLLCLLVLFGAFASLLDIHGLYTGSLPLWSFIPIFSTIAALLTPVMIVFAVLAWKRRCWGPGGRIHYTLVTLAATGFVWFMYVWNILGRAFA